LPSGLKSGVKTFLPRILGEHNYAVLLARCGLMNDFSGYEKLIGYIEAHKIGALPGNFLEIGAFMGGGSAKLARCASRYGKKLIVIDPFNPNLDSTPWKGRPLNAEYRDLLGRRNQRDVFDRNTRFENNIIVYAEDSKLVTLSPDVQLCFSFIDGNHSPPYVISDFYLAWNATVPGGVVSFHDYDETGRGGLVEVTKAVNQLIELHQLEISDKYWIGETGMIFLRKA
jgi:hypothetical protein